MAEFLAYRILIGKMTLEQVPKALKAKTQKVLEESGYYDIA